MKPPIAKKIPKKLELHGDVRVDEYFWLNQREDSETIDYITKENEYTSHKLEPIKELREELFTEMKARIKEDDASAPYFKNGFWYYSRYEIGSEHPIYCRKKESLDSDEEILLNENELAKGHSYYEVVSYSVSKNNEWLAFADDRTGRRLYRIRFMNLKTREIIDPDIEDCSSDLAWHNDNETLYYCLKDKETLRPHEICSIKKSGADQQSIYTEGDETYIVGISKSTDMSTLFIGSYSTLTTEFQIKSADDVEPFEVFLDRKRGHEYYPEIAGGTFFIKTNHEALNFKITSCSYDKRSIEDWSDYQAHDENIFVEDFEVFEKYAVIQEKVNGLSQLKVYSRDSDEIRIIPAREETFTLYIGTNNEYRTKDVRIGYSSMTTPHSVFDIEFESFEWNLIKQSPVLGDFDPENYGSKRIWATASDGVKVPASIVYRKDSFQQDGTNPILVYGYGSYGSTIDPYFSSVRLSLLDRGFVFVLAHIRGGEYMGRAWYEDGKLLKKKNTFTDFIAVTEHLVKEKFCAEDQVYAMGGSAGGLLMGAIANLRPELYKGIVSQVPFVDVISTMIDETIPLTTGEYDEWGNPKEEEYYRYILSYSPYDQLEEKAYPNMLIISGLHDSQVQYWEPTKYVAKLRDLKTDNNLLLLHTNMEAGHGGASGRFEALKEIALNYGFLIGLNDELI